MKSIDWHKVRGDTSNFVVSDKKTCYVAYQAKSGRKRLGAGMLVTWQSFEARQAQDWLRRASIADANASGECAVCCVRKHYKLFYGVLSGKRYCTSKCYDTLFGKCLDCGRMNMACLTNAKPNPRNPEWGGPENHICDECHQKKHNYGIVCLSFR